MALIVYTGQLRSVILSTGNEAVAGFPIEVPDQVAAAMCLQNDWAYWGPSPQDSASTQAVVAADAKTADATPDPIPAAAAISDINDTVDPSIPAVE